MDDWLNWWMNGWTRLMVVWVTRNVTHLIDFVQGGCSWEKLLVGYSLGVI